jgi:hypothetical protein
MALGRYLKLGFSNGRHDSDPARRAADSCLFLESPKNTWLPNGHNWQRADLPVYLPANGALLTAAAMMACSRHGFPKNGWNARWEGFGCATWAGA